MHYKNAYLVCFLMGLDYSDQLMTGGVDLFCLQWLASAMDHRLEAVEPIPLLECCRDPVSLVL